MRRTLTCSRRFILPAWRRFGRWPAFRDVQNLGPHRPARALFYPRRIHLCLLLRNDFLRGIFVIHFRLLWLVGSGCRVRAATAVDAIEVGSPLDSCQNSIAIVQTPLLHKTPQILKHPCRVHVVARFSFRSFSSISRVSSTALPQCLLTTMPLALVPD
jgi:hypothetical protein